MSEGRTRQALRTCVLVTFVALFIWVYAESESLRRESRRVTLRFVSPVDNTRIAWLDPSSATRIEVELSLQGSTASLDSMRSRLTAAIDLSPGDPGVPATPGSHELLLRDVLRQLPRFTRAGVTLDSVQPASVTLHIEDLVPIQATVRAQLPSGMSATFSAVPPTVTVYMTKRLADQMGDDPAVYAQVTADRVPNVVGPTMVTGLRLLVPSASANDMTQGFVRIEPSTADLTVSVNTKTVTQTVAQVPIQLGVPSDALDLYRVEFVSANYLTDVRVTGSPAAIGQLKQRTGSIPLFAYVPLLYDDLHEGEIDASIVFGHLDVEGVAIESDTTTVRLKISRRNTGTGTSDGETPDTSDPGTLEQPSR